MVTGHALNPGPETRVDTPTKPHGLPEQRRIWEVQPGVGARCLPSYALAALTRLDHSRPAAVSGSGIIPGSRRRKGRSRPSASDSSEAEMVAAWAERDGAGERAERDDVAGANQQTCHFVYEHRACQEKPPAR